MSASSLLTTSNWLKNGTKQLQKTGITTARLDCLVLLEDATSLNRSLLLAYPEQILQTKIKQKLDRQLKRRIKHEPLAYICHKTEFYGRSFYINHSVLEPRPESETIIDLLKGLSISTNTVIADIGTGSGALAITCKLEIPGYKIVATDIDSSCLKVAKKNAKTLATDIQFFEGDLLDPLGQLEVKNLILLCNLPYVPDSFQINPAALREPRLAIFGGKDGLEVYRRLFTQLKVFPNTSIMLLTESMPPQHQALSAIAHKSGFKLQKTNDFIQMFVANI